MNKRIKTGETNADAGLQFIDTTSSQPFTKHYVIGSFVVPADYDEGPECEDDGCEFCNDIHCGGSCQEEYW